MYNSTLEIKQINHLKSELILVNKEKKAGQGIDDVIDLKIKVKKVGS